MIAAVTATLVAAVVTAVIPAATATALLALALLALLLLLGTAIGRLLGVHQWGIPEALIAGLLGLLLAPAGPLPLIPAPVVAIWQELPLALLTLVFATLLLGKPLPKPAGLWRPLGAQVLLALTMAFGQFAVAGVAVLLLQPWLGVNPVMACLIEVAYEGGHGAAAALGPTYERLGMEGGQALGLALASVGLLASTLVGGALVLLARRQGWLLADAGPATAPEPGPAAPREHDPAGWAVNLGLCGAAVALGWGLWRALQAGGHQLGGGLAQVVTALPVFPLALIGSLLVRLLLERWQRGSLASARHQGRIGTLAADLLITAATASLNLTLLGPNWLPLTVLALAGLGCNLTVLLLMGPRMLPAPWFERGILEFGQATGVAASGLLLLNLADPGDRGDALTPFSIKQLLLQPLLAGGVITVLAPLAVAGWGLGRWTGLCLLLMLLFGSLGLLLAGRRPPADLALTHAP